MLLKPVRANLDNEKPSLSEEYDGIVVNNLDPLMLGRVQVSYALVDECPNDDDLPWCYPSNNVFLGNSKNSIMFSVPEVGSSVRVYFPTRDKYTPFYKGMEFNTDNMCTFFADEDYPNVYGFKDSTGNFVKVNKRNNTILLQHSSTGNLLIKEDGSFRCTLPDGSFIEMFVGGHWKISGGASGNSVLQADASGNVTLKCANFTVKSGSVTLDAPEAGCTGTFSVGKGDSGMIVGNNCISYVNAGIVTMIKNP